MKRSLTYAALGFVALGISVYFARITNPSYTSYCSDLVRETFEPREIVDIHESEETREPIRPRIAKLIISSNTSSKLPSDLFKQVNQASERGEEFFRIRVSTRFYKVGPTGQTYHEAVCTFAKIGRYEFLTRYTVDTEAASKELINMLFRGSETLGELSLEKQLANQQ